MRSLRGRFVHENINKSNPLRNERTVGWIFHYFTGATLAITYPAILLWLNGAVPDNNLIPGLIWGLATALLPWLVLFPDFGWGLFDVRSPQNIRPVLSPSVEHSIYGLGVGIVLNITSQLW